MGQGQSKANSISRWALFNVKLHFFTSLLYCFKGNVKGRGQCQGQGSRSNFWHAAVDIRGTVLPSATKNSNYHYQPKVIVCVSVIIGRMRITARMRSIGFFIVIVLGV